MCRCADGCSVCGEESDTDTYGIMCDVCRSSIGSVWLAMINDYARRHSVGGRLPYHAHLIVTDCVRTLLLGRVPRQSESDRAAGFETVKQTLMG